MVYLQIMASNFTRIIQTFTFWTFIVGEIEKEKENGQENKRALIYVRNNLRWFNRVWLCGIVLMGFFSDKKKGVSLYYLVFNLINKIPIICKTHNTFLKIPLLFIAGFIIKIKYFKPLTRTLESFAKEKYKKEVLERQNIQILCLLCLYYKLTAIIITIHL